LLFNYLNFFENNNKPIKYIINQRYKISDFGIIKIEIKNDKYILSKNDFNEYLTTILVLISLKFF
jgi:hypothetical protein